jgi:hypothetical protein
MSSPRRAFVGVVAVVALAGCRARLPAEPPDRDATAADAAIPAWSPPPDATRTSAFAGERLDASGHAHHGHGHGAKAADPTTPAPEAVSK